MNFIFYKLKNLKKHEFHFFASLKNLKKHAFRCNGLRQQIDERGYRKEDANDLLDAVESDDSRLIAVTHAYPDAQSLTKAEEWDDFFGPLKTIDLDEEEYSIKLSRHVKHTGSQFYFGNHVLGKSCHQKQVVNINLHERPTTLFLKTLTNCIRDIHSYCITSPGGQGARSCTGPLGVR